MNKEHSENRQRVQTTQPHYKGNTLSVYKNFEKWLDECIEKKRHHLQGVIWKTMLQLSRINVHVFTFFSYDF